MMGSAGALSFGEFATYALPVPCDCTPAGENVTNRQGHWLGWQPDLLPYNNVSHLFSS
jgi:hypothetical protein